MTKDLLPDGGESATLREQIRGSLSLRQTFELTFYVAAFVVVVFMLATGQSYTWEDRVFPTLVAIPTAAFCIIKMVFIVRPNLAKRFTTDSETSSLQERLSKSIEGTSEEDEGRSPATRRRVELQLLAWISVLPFAMYYFGMVKTLPIWVFGFAWFFFGNLRAAAGVTAVFSGISYVIFIVFLELQPWTGALFG